MLLFKSIKEAHRVTILISVNNIPRSKELNFQL